MAQEDNVIKFPNNSKGLFNPEIRERIETGLKPFTQQPSEAAIAVEQVFCAYAVDSAKNFATFLGNKLGEFIMSKVSNEQ